ncbi:MAG TPA: DUF58 domain-containing protein [Mycobacteriales bacterium]|nr:DUF58 domain-containing protein [Mycobacteriales bacterium]
MRTALSALTTRGRCLLAAGVASALCSVTLGEKDLLRVACFLVALPLLAAGAVVRTQFRLRCARRVDPGRVPVGQPARVLLELENVSYLPTGLLLLEDDLPYALGGRTRFMLDRIRPGYPRQVHYEIRSDVRGRHRVGPLRLRLTDPFGLVELTRSFTTTDRLTVVPAVQPLPAVRVGGSWHAGGDSAARAVAVRGEDDAATREYRHGDDLRKVHWRSTARTGTLMVRQEERPWQSTATLLLDTRLAAHRGDGPASSLEWAVSAVASIGVHLGRLGYTLRYLTDAGLVRPGVDFVEDAVLLDQLADVTGSHHRRLDGALAALRGGDGTHGTLVAVLGQIGIQDAQALVAARSARDGNIAVLLDTGSWAGGGRAAGSAGPTDHELASRQLGAAGWRVVRARYGDQLPMLWSQADNRAGAPDPASASASALGPTSVPNPTGTAGWP